MRSPQAGSISASGPDLPLGGPWDFVRLRSRDWVNMFASSRVCSRGRRSNGQRKDSHKIRFLNPELELINLHDPIPVHISAFGPRGRSLTAKLGAHWITVMRGAQPAIAALAEMQKAWQEAGRDLKALYSTAFGGGCVLAEGEPTDSARAKALAGPAAAIVFHNKAEEQELGSIGFPTPPQFKTKFDAYGEIYRKYQPPDARYLSNHRGHLMFLRPEEHDIISADVIRAFTFTG